MRFRTVLAAATVLIGTTTGCEDEPVRSTVVIDSRGNIIRTDGELRWDMLLIPDTGPDAPFQVANPASAETVCGIYAGTFEVLSTEWGDEWWCRDITYTP